MKRNFSTLLSLLQFGIQELKKNQISNAKLEARWLLLNILNKNSSWFLLNQKDKPKSKVIHLFLDYVNQRKDHVPIQLIMGKASFYGIDFMISPGVFIPRPETELIIDILKKKNLIQF